MDCAEVREKYSDYIDCCLGSCQGEVESHLSDCPECRSELGALREMVGKLNCLPQYDVPPDFLVRLNERLDLEERSFIARLFDYLSLGNPSRALATAATALLLVLGGYYLTTHDGLVSRVSRHQPAVETPAIDVARTETTATGAGNINLFPTNPHQRAIPVASTKPSGQINPVPINPPPLPRRVSAPMPAMIEIATANSRDYSKVPYIDNLVLLKNPNPAVATQMVRRAALAVNAQYFDYSDNVILVQTTVENADYFVQVLEMMGAIEIIHGPIDRGLPTLIFQVIVVP